MLLETKLVRTLSKIASFVIIIYSKLVRRIKTEYRANLAFFTFFDKLNKRHKGSIDNKTTGILALNSFMPKNLKDKHSSQKNNGGFSKKKSLFRYSVIYSFELNIFFAIST